MKRALVKDSVKQIKNTFKRYISILLMALLGVGFFAGIKATSPDMQKTLDSYFDNQNVYDIQVVSTLGITKDDIEAVKNLDNIEEVLGVYSKDEIVKIGDEEKIIKIISYSQDTNALNKFDLTNGSLPENSDECIVEQYFLDFLNKSIGDYIEIEDEDNTLNNKKLKIVGVANSPLYISRDRGTSKLGSGKINYYLYVPDTNINSDIYTELYATVKGAKDVLCFSDEYDKLIEEAKSEVEGIKGQREKARYDEIIGTATKELNEAQEKFDNEKQEAESQIEEAENQIEENRQKLEDAENEIAYNRVKANKEFESAESQIEEAENQLVIAEEEFNSKKDLIFSKKEDAESTLATLNENLDNLEKNIEEMKKRADETEDEKLKVVIETQILLLETNKTNLEVSINVIQNTIDTLEKQFNDAEQKIIDGKNELEAKKAELEETKESTYAELASATWKVNNGKQELQEAEETLAENKIEFEEKIKEAEIKLLDAKEKINDIENPKWYILDRTSNAGYKGYYDDTQSILNIGKVFPLVFFVVATLISLTSMTRMVEEQRVQIGTLKALGYNKLQIAMKYIIYSGSATLIGGFLGMCIGFPTLPRIVFIMYAMMYTLPDIIIEFNTYYATIGLSIASLCIVGATIYSCIRELNQEPAVLMRPKAPKAGKRVLLEKIPFIWSHLSFNGKVTVRNIFRYKKRFLMTIIGIAGCTALIVAGFGLRDSISSILPIQFGELSNYEFMANLKSSITLSDVENLQTDLLTNEKITDLTKAYFQSGKIYNDEKDQDVQIIVPEDKQKFKEFVKMRSTNRKEEYNIDNNTIILTQKAAKLLNIKEGDKITLENSDNSQVEVKVGKIIENYIYHYVYMSENLYKQLYGEFDYNVLYIKSIDLNEEDESNLAKEILNDYRVSAITTTSSLLNSMDETMECLNYVVWILIISAGLLAFVVLYNLSNVNISERIRELATIKVLGFYDKEVYDYVIRETILLTAIGIIIGLLFGYLLNFYILQTCELNYVMFYKFVKPISYVYAIAITIVFTEIVNLVTFKFLKKIDMIESLKSVE